MKTANPFRHPFRVPRIEEPRTEGFFHLRDGRRLGYAEYGNLSGPIVLWFHGTPGGRRQFPLGGRRAAEKFGLRVVMVERPGAGLSDPHRYEAVADWAADMEQVADALNANQVGIVGYSGGGPYALSCCGHPAFASRVAAAGVLGCVPPAVGPDATATGAVDLARRATPVVGGLRRPMAWMLTGLVLPLIPFGHYGYRGFANLMPECDQEVFSRPDIEAMLIDDVILAAKGRFQAMVDDVRLFGRDWGFRLADVKVRVRWWHGDADPIVPCEAAEAAASQLPDVDFIVRSGESHLGSIAAANEVLEAISPFL